MEKISACLVIRNEERNIKRCLESIKEVVDEIIVAHDGECSDRTLEICRAYGAKIFKRPYAGFMEAHLPFCFNEAQGDWLLRIDGDEYLSDKLRSKLRILTRAKEVDAYEFLWPIWDGKEYLTKQWPRKRCLFRKNNIFFLGLLHYLPAVSGKIKECNLILEHKPDYYNLARPVFLNKWLGQSKIQARLYLKDFSDVEKYNYKYNSWPNIIKLRKNIPLILMPFEFIITLYNNLTNGAWREGKAGFLYSLYCGVYRLMVNYYIYLYKKDKYKKI